MATVKHSPPHEHSEKNSRLPNQARRPASLFTLFLHIGTVLTLSLCNTLSHAEGENGWLTFPIASKHFRERENPRGWNQFNPGIGYEYPYSDTLLITGLVYKNSYAKPTFGAGVIWRPLEYSIFKLGLTAMVVTGYEPPFMIAPILSIEYKGFGADIVVAPSLGKDTAGFVGLMLKIQI